MVMSKNGTPTAPDDVFEKHIVNAINGAMASGIHPARIIACLEICKVDVINAIKRVPDDGSLPPLDTKQILKLPTR